MNFIPLRQAALRAAIVDLDGTMVDTLGDFTVALHRTLDALGLPRVPRDTIGRMVGKGSEHLIRTVLAHVEAPPALYSQAWDAYQRHYLEVNGQHADVYPGVVDGLTALRARGFKLACLTNKPTLFARALLRQKDLARFFDVVFGGDAFARQKPDPLPLLETCKALGSLPAHTLMIGDSSNDARAARSAGCPVVLMTYGYNHGEPVQGVDTDGCFDSMLELAQSLSAAQRTT